MIYLCKFDHEGNRTETYAQFVHFITEEDDFVKQKLNSGFVLVNETDYNNLLGNNADNQIYIRNNNGEYIPKPPYVPTPQEVQEQKLKELDETYNKKFEEKDNEIVNAVIVLQDQEYANQLRQERTALTQEYAEKRGAL